MADDIPADVRKQLEESGFSFDSDGQIVEENFTDNFGEVPEDDIDDIDDDQDDQDDEDHQDDDKDDQDQDQDDEDQDDDDDQDDDAEDEPPVRSKGKTLNLTPRDPKGEEDDIDDGRVTSRSLKKMQADMELRISELAKGTDGDDSYEDSASVKELKAEAEKFQRMRMQMFAKEIEQDVNSMSLGADFNDIITSNEWQDYLKSSILGTTIGTLYVDSIKENDSASVVGFFEDFTERFLPKVSSAKKVSKTVKKAVKSAPKPSLDDLSVPNRSKTTNTPRKRSKFDYEEDDYAKMLDDAERGKISHKEFEEFDTKFTDALSKGRVKKSR